MLFTCGKGSGTGPVVDDNVNTRNPPTVSMFLEEFFSHPVITDSRYYGHQIRVPRVSVTARVDYTMESCDLEILGNQEKEGSLTGFEIRKLVLDFTCLVSLY